MASQAPAISFAIPTMAPLLPASVPGLMGSSQPAQFHLVTSQMGQGSVWQGVPGALGQLRQLPQGVQLSQGVQLLHGVQLPQVVQPVELPQRLQLLQGLQQVQLPQGLLGQEGVQLVHLSQLPQGLQQVQLPQGLQLPPGPAAFAPSYTWGQQLMMGTLVPHQPMGLGPGALGQGQTLYPTGSCHLPGPAYPSPPPHRGRVAQWMQGPPVPHTAQEPAEASGKDRLAMELGVPTASPHQPALAAPASSTTGKPTGECWGWQSPRAGGQAQESCITCLGLALFALPAAAPTQAALDSPAQRQQGPAACAEPILEPAQDTVADDMSARLGTTDCGDGAPDASDSPGLVAFLSELPDASEYVAEGGCPKD